MDDQCYGCGYPDYLCKCMDVTIRNDTAKQIRKVRRILKSMGYLKPKKVKTERDVVIEEGRF